MPLLLGCIADDLTGATDLALMLNQAGMPTMLHLGVPPADSLIDWDQYPACVIALKSRTEPAADAVRASIEAANFLRGASARQIYFKYCSTFDSTPEGNIGPVADALLNLCEAQATIVAPSFPATGRTVRDGMLYVNGVLLEESPMRNHPLTPMTESSLLRLMDAQTAYGASALVPLKTVRAGGSRLRSELEQLEEQGCRYLVTDAETDEDLACIAGAVTDMPVITGASGIGATLPAQLAARDLLKPKTADPAMPATAGGAVVLAGSCSTATRAQVARFSRMAASFRIDPLSKEAPSDDIDSLTERVSRAAREGDVLIYSSAEPEELAEIQSSLGAENAGQRVEEILSGVARALYDRGKRRFIVAGGETSGAVGAALGLKELTIGPQIDPGVPWMVSMGDESLCIAFKSGNFGSDDFFSRALEMLP